MDIHLYLQRSGFPVPQIILTKGKQTYAKSSDGLLHVLYEFIDGGEPGEIDVENIGELIGELHSKMEHYGVPLAKRDKHFFIDRYVNILNDKKHLLADEYRRYGEMLWNKVKDLPRGYCHGDLYRGNILKAKDGRLYVLDLDTSCHAFPMYDITLFCNETNYFRYSDDGFDRSREWLKRFVHGYRKRRLLSDDEVNAFYYLQAIYHYQLQATIVEIYGIDCNGPDFEAEQLGWIISWLERAKASGCIGGWQ